MADVRYEQATKLYSGTDVPAVDALDLEVEDGEFMVLVGPSGSGKTTALRMLAGLEEVDAGAVFIGDRDVSDDPPKARDVAMVFQNYALYPYLTVAANIGFPLRIAKVPKRDREARVRAVDKQVGPPRELYERPANLFVAGFIGSPAMNLLPAEALGAATNGKVEGFRPEHLDIVGDGEGISARVEVVEDIGADVYVFCSADVKGEQTRLVARTDVRNAPQQRER